MIDGISIILIIYLARLFSEKYPWPKRIFLSISAHIAIAIFGSFISIAITGAILNSDNFLYPGAVYTLITASLIKSFYFSIVGFVLLFFFRKKYTNYHQITSISSDINAPIDSDWEVAMIEINEGRQNKALWARALVASNGDRPKSEAEYLKLRAKQISQERLIDSVASNDIKSLNPNNSKEDPRNNPKKFFLHFDEIAILAFIGMMYLFFIFVK